MNLVQLADNNRTDKNTVHSYLPLYDQLLESRRETAKDVLEIGIAQGGGSIKLWNDYFQHANIYGLDIIPKSMVPQDLYELPRVTLHTSTNAYDRTFVENEFVTKGIRFDMVLDDGPHTLESMVLFIKLFSPLLKEDGILIIEDVQSLEWIDILKHIVDDSLTPYIRCYDLRSNKGRYDDIVFTIDKSLKLNN